MKYLNFLKNIPLKKICFLIISLVFITALSAENVTIYEIQYTDQSSGNSPYSGQEVTTTGIVTAVGASGYDDNFFISMPEGGAWKGLYVYMSEADVSVGDEVEVTGHVEEYYNYTEISGYSNPVTVNILSSGNTLPDPVVISTSDLSSEEMYESVLVRIENVTVVAEPDNYGQWFVDDGSGDCQIDDVLYQYSNPMVGDSFASITGIVDYNFEEFGLNPRNAADFSFGDDTTAPTLQSATALSIDSVLLSFSEVVDEDSAVDDANYEIDGLDITGVTIQSGNSSVLINTSDQTPGEQYFITVNSVSDLAGNVINDDSQISFTGFQTGGGGEDLFLSEYLEGSSNNKALEIFNPTDNTVDLANYAVWRISNGGDWAEGEENAVELSGSLAPGDVFVICNSSASTDIQNVSDLIGTTATYFNGNDAVGLAKNGVLLDVIGTEGADPGDDGWDVAGVAGGTKEHTLVRKSSVTEGTTDWALSAGTNADDSQWIVLEQDDISNLGFHEAGGEDTNPPVISSATALSATSVEISFNEALEQTTAQNTSNYSITGLTISAAVLNNNKVTLTTSEQTADNSYTITVNNVEDLAGNVIAANSTVNFTGYTESDYTQIADIQNNTSAWEGQTVTIHGIVTIGVNTIQTGRTNAYIQDNSGRGINIYDSSVINELVRGNEVEVTGEVTQYENTTEITLPQVTLLSTGNPEPTPLTLDLADATDISLEGTLLRVTGEIYDVYAAGGGANLNIIDDDGNTLTVRVWDTTGIDTSEYIVGYFLEAIGVGSEYQDKLQILVGYQDQLGEGSNVDPGIVLDPENPEPGENVTLFYTSPDELTEALLYWRTGDDADFNIESMELVDETVITYSAVIPGQKQGTRVYFYLELYHADETITYLPINAPEELNDYSYPVTSHKAILSVPAEPFNPYAGDKFPIHFAAKQDNKAILRIYNAEGKLVYTPKNLIVNSSDGINIYEWDGRDKQRQLLPLGLYICHLEVIDKDSGKIKTDTAPIVIGAPLK